MTAPELKKVQDYIDGFRLGLKAFEMDEDTRTSELAAAALGVEVGQIAKSILFMADGEPVLVVASGDMKIKSGRLKRLTGASKIKMADPETVKSVTGFEVGGVCPLALPQRVKIYLDDSMKRFAVVYAAAGTHRSVLPVNMEQLQTITGGEWADLTGFSSDQEAFQHELADS
ncbi:MAG: YbaK/EbsC family protein [Peptococcaceae bacterium]|nr:YbaK/EbsC family protein [Peptococcaceae bacterium]